MMIAAMDQIVHVCDAHPRVMLTQLGGNRWYCRWCEVELLNQLGIDTGHRPIIQVIDGPPTIGEVEGRLG